MSPEIEMAAKRHTRRGFLSSAAAPLLPLLSRRAMAASDTFNLAFIGLGGQGTGLLGQVISGHVRANVVALCDVDEQRGRGLKVGLDAYPKARVYRDYRRMFDDMHKDIDGVVIATCNHQHARPGMIAMQLRKHLYLEKPLAPTVSEIRQLARAADKYNVTTQMGNYGRSMEGTRIARDFVRSGKLGTVTAVHVWTTRTAARRVPRLSGGDIPRTLDWDLWLGPAKWRDYSPEFVQSWQAWWDFGGGPLFDIGCHTIDAPVYALDLDAPISVEAVEYEPVAGNQPPRGGVVRYEFAAKAARPAVSLTWYDAPNVPPRPPQLRERETLERIRYAGEGGSVFIGEKNTMVAAGMKPWEVTLLPLSNPEDTTAVPPGGVIGRASIAHFQQWIEAAVAGKKSENDFNNGAARVSEIVALGAVAQRMPKGTKLLWDSARMSFTNSPDANAYLDPFIRPAWRYGG